MKIRNIRYFVTLSFIVLLLACEGDSKVKESIIPDDKMINLLIDLHIAEGATQRFAVQEQDSVKNMFLTQILEIHHLRQGQIDSTLELLYQQPEKYQTMQSAVLDSMRSIEKKIKKEI